MTIELALLAHLSGVGVIDLGYWLLETVESGQRCHPLFRLLTTGCQPEPECGRTAAAAASCKSMKYKVGRFLCRKFQGIHLRAGIPPRRIKSDANKYCT